MRGVRNEAIMAEFRQLLENKGPNLNQLKWRQMLNVCSRDDILDKLTTVQVGEIVGILSKSPNQIRFHELMFKFGERLLKEPRDAQSGPGIARAYLEAGLHASNPELIRMRKSQVTLARATARALIPTCVQGTVESLRTDAFEHAYLLALALRQGYISREDLSIDTVINRGLEQAGDLASMDLRKRAEFAWAINVLSNHSRKETLKFFTLRDLQSFAYHKNFTSISLVPRREWFQIIQILDSLDGDSTSVSETVLECLDDKSAVCGTMAAHALWWRVISGGIFDNVAAKCMRICMDKADSLSEIEQWKSRTALHTLGSRPITEITLKKQLEYCNKNDILGQPKRAAVAWRHIGNNRNSYSVS